MEIIIYTSQIYSIFFVELILDRQYLKRIHQRGERRGQILDYYNQIWLKNLNNVDSLNINPKVFQTTKQVRLCLILIRNEIVNARVMYQCTAFAKCLYLGYRNSLLPLHSHRALLWPFNFAGKK